MIEALARKYVGCITMHNCNFSNAAHDRALAGETFFDVQRPNGAYTLDLARAAQYAMAAVLVRYWRHEGRADVESATLGRPGARLQRLRTMVYS